MKSKHKTVPLGQCSNCQAKNIEILQLKKEIRELQKELIASKDELISFLEKLTPKPEMKVVYKR